MAVTYVQALSTDLIVSDIEALFDWHSHILRQCFYPGSQSSPASSVPPAALLSWCHRESDKGALDHITMEKIQKLHDDMKSAAENILQHCVSGALPPMPLFDALENQVVAYITQIHMLEQSVSSTSIAMDPVTGLRTVAGMRSDLKKEQDRFDRKGTSFSIANVEIDNMEGLKNHHDRKGLEAIYAHVASVIAKTVRSFDEAYFLGKGEYMIVLKHIEFMDACTVLDRLRTDIEEKPVTMPDSESVKVTASFGVAEALLKESADISLINAKAALKEAKKHGGNRVQEHHEMSALEKMMQSTKK